MLYMQMPELQAIMKASRMYTKQQPVPIVHLVVEVGRVAARAQEVVKLEGVAPMTIPEKMCHATSSLFRVYHFQIPALTASHDTTPVKTSPTAQRLNPYNRSRVRLLQRKLKRHSPKLHKRLQIRYLP